MTLKQKELEGGFCGRTNKIVDSCYSVWVGAVFSMLNEYSGFNFNLEGKLLYD
jgi:prenyltransferase beta subunit